jgi:hypothetical protein
LKNETKDKELEDMLTELDPPYESKEELMIGHVLDQYGIPFFYKQPIIIHNQGRNEIWKPAFTLYSYGGAVIDYFDGPAQNEIRSRQQVYLHNQIPAIVLESEVLHKQGWQRDLYRKLKQLYREIIDQAGYLMASNTR